MAKVLAKKLDFARRLRREQTDAENTLWKLLRSKQLSDFKFRRQHVIGPFIVDFCCIQEKFIVELDGHQHLDNKIYDTKRTQFLEQKGYKVIRFWDNDMLINPISVSNALTLALSHRRRERGKECDA
jgi:very-short-patch-repair endonuclease